MSRRERLLTQLLIAPRSLEIDERKRRFDELNEFVQARLGWLTSVPGAVEVTVECLPDSSLPDDLRALGYRVTPTGEGERILPFAITERFLTEGSTVDRIRHHAGIVAVEKYEAIAP